MERAGEKRIRGGADSRAAPRAGGADALDRAAASTPLIAPPTADGAGGAMSGAAIFLAAVLLSAWTYWPTLRNGFLLLGFDDAIVTDTAFLHGIDRRNLTRMATEFVQAHYVPLTMFSLAIDHQLWGLDPTGYHATNIALHALVAALFAAFIRPLMPSAASTLTAAAVFAVHPLQLEAVTLVIQRKTLLSGAAIFLTLILYREWRRSGRAWLHAASLLAFAAAALAKPIAVCVPPLLWLCDYTFHGRPLRLRGTLPHCIIAAATALAALAAHHEVAALHAPHGGSLAAHVLMMGRATAEYAAALFVPAHLSPVRYYPLATPWHPLSFAGLAAVLLVAAHAVLARRHHPWNFFCVAWFAICLLPESNIVPLAQLSADRFLYLAMAGFAVWSGVAVHALVTQSRLGRAGYALAACVAIALSVQTRSAAAIWKSDVSAWQRVVAIHPWSALAHQKLGRARESHGDLAGAEQAYLVALDRAPERAETHLELARLYRDNGLAAPARRRIERALALQPENARALSFLADLAAAAPRVEP